jgi:gluconolactonase
LTGPVRRPFRVAALAHIGLCFATAREAALFNPFQETERIEARTFTSLPGKFRKKERTAWSDPNRGGAQVDSFLEGPSFDREGNLWCVDIPFGRIFRIDPKGEWELAVQYDGWPNGLKIHKDGRIFIADYQCGLMLLDPKSGRIETCLATAFSEGFKGLNDLHFADSGDLYFTDQGQTGIADPTGRVYRLRSNGELQRLVDNAPSPNGITLNTGNTHVYVAVTRSQQIWRLPLMPGGTPSKTGVAIQLSGGHAGPDGIETDAEDGLAVCHLGVGIWRFDSNALPTHLVHAGKPHRLMTNIAYGGNKGSTLYITDSLNGEILTAEMPVPGKKMFAHR